jgi:hypothetical protein
MINLQHPIVCALRDRGLKVALHLYVNEGGASALATAHDPSTKKTIDGRNKTGDIMAALEALGRAAGVPVIR